MRLCCPRGWLPRTRSCGMRTVRTLVPVIVALLPAAAGAQVVKCVGPDGRVEYASVCPPGTSSRKLDIRSAPAAPSTAPSSQEKSLAEREAEFRKRRLEQEQEQQKTEKKLAEAEQRRRACESARAYLKALEERQRITRTDPRTGERVYLEDADYPREIAAAQRAVSDNCE